MVVLPPSVNSPWEGVRVKEVVFNVGCGRSMEAELIDTSVLPKGLFCVIIEDNVASKNNSVKTTAV